MVRANCANTNAEIHAPLSSHPQARKSTFNAPSPAAGGGMGCPLALGQRRARGPGRLGRRCARVARAHPLDGAAALALTRSESANRSSADTGEPDGARALQTARQRPASSRTTRKDFW
jgi:hypothetical protein